ncbi:MAG: YaaA family protein [Muribaculaceae bacterium]|nr:YaaA family protein [Muribaculaceae bacterium]
MLILIAESKTMTACDKVVTPEEFSEHRPLFDPLAANIMSRLEDKSIAELSNIIGISISLARQMKTMIYEFPNKSLGEEAIRAYTGVVFKALDYNSLDENGKGNCIKKVKIISSLYGWLNADDIIKSYRTEFKSEIAPLSAPLWKYYRQHNTIALGKCLTANGYTEILNLLPGDAAKSIDWKTIKRFAKVYKADFVEVSEKGEKTPNAGKLKKLRGELLRDILSAGIERISDLKDLEGDNYIFEGTPLYPDHLLFTTD